MRIFSALMGLLGAVGALFLGFKWYSDLHSADAQAAIQSGLANAQFAALTNATYALLVCGVIGLVVCAMILMNKGNKMANAALLVLAGVLPLFFVSKAIFGVPMVLGGLLAFGMKSPADAEAS